MFKRNEGLTDRVLRFVVAAGFVVAAVALPLTGIVAVAAYVVAAILAVTALVGVCPLYSLLGVDTCPTKRPS